MGLGVRPVGCHVVGCWVLGVGAALVVAPTASSAGRVADAGAIPGVTSFPSGHMVMTALDVAATGPDRVGEVVRGLSQRARRAGGTEVVVAVGGSLFEKAGGAAGMRPRQLRRMPDFPGDLLDPARCHGDLLVQVGASTAEQAEEVSGRLLDGLAGVERRWSMVGFRPQNEVEGGRGLTRNLFGFTEGFGNPGPGPAEAMVRVAEPGWAAGGSYQVVRIIRIAASLWDADSIGVQERVLGRRRDGRWLDGTPAFGEPRFGADPAGGVTAVGLSCPACESPSRGSGGAAVGAS